MSASNASGGAALVSILTPSFNQAQWLCDNLKSVSCQTYSNIEHVVMDGGSTDQSRAILEAAGISVLWRSEPDDGQADAINKAFSASQGEIIGWLNSDDAYFDCKVVEDVVSLFERRPDVDVVYGHCLQTAENGHAIQVLWAPRYDSELMRAVDIFAQPSVFVRRRVLSDPMLDVSFHFALDYELWLRLDAAGARFARLDRVLSIDRHQLSRKSATIKDVWAADLERLSSMYDTRLGPEGEKIRSSYYMRQRLSGARLIGQVRRSQRELAFTAPEDFASGLWSRQVFTRRGDWPAEYR